MQNPENEQKILVVDDSRATNKALELRLRSAGYTVKSAFSGQEALEAFKNEHFDLISLDMEMPGLNGFDTLTELRKLEESKSVRQNKGVPIIFVIGKDDLALRKKGFDLGAMEVISKELMEEDLIRVVDGILRPSLRFKGLKALVVDDSKVTRMSVSHLLSHYGVEVTEADDGSVALAILEKDKTYFDVIISDLNMKKMDGDELCERTRRTLGLRQIPFFIITADGSKDKLIELFRLGATDYITKPFIQEELIARLSVHLQARVLQKTLREQVVELKKLKESQDKFLAACSHDLRSPLQGILGFAELILEDSDADLEEVLTGVKHIQASGETLSTLINDIMDLSKAKIAEDESKVRVDFAEIVEEAATSLKLMSDSKGVHLIFSKRSSYSEVIGSPSALMRSVSNLISNAIKFTPVGGSVTIELANAKNSTLTLDIKDTGIGIPKDKLETIFDEFSNFSREGTSGEKSSGLGLSLVKVFVEKNNGKIEVVSKENEGSTFTITLPCAAYQRI